MDQEVIKELSRNVYGFALTEVVLVIGIIAILLSILVPTFINYRKTVSETVCKKNRMAIERLFEASNIYINSEISFNSFIEEYPDDICPDGGVISYEDDEVKCSKHPSQVEPPHEEVPWL